MMNDATTAPSAKSSAKPPQMCMKGTPIEPHPDLGLWVKREDLCCPGGPNFSKTRGVYTHVAARPEPVIGVLDTVHSQGGWAVARACQLLGKMCVLYYPLRKADCVGEIKLKPQQAAARQLGATILPLKAGRSAVLYHQARKDLYHTFHAHDGPGGTYMMPNALKLPEMVVETAAEVMRTAVPGGWPGVALISASSGTIAAGVWKGLWEVGFEGTLIVHMGYSRSQEAMLKYMTQCAWGADRGPLDGEIKIELVDEGYDYADVARPGPLPSFPCNEHYDLKAFRWWMREGRAKHKEALLWNIG